MGDFCKYPTPNSLEELLEVFRQEGMSEQEIEQVVESVRPDEADVAPRFVPPELDDTIKIYERVCSVCNREFKTTAAMQDLVPADSPFNICDGCYNRFYIIDDDEQFKSEIKAAFRGFFGGEN